MASTGISATWRGKTSWMDLWSPLKRLINGLIIVALLTGVVSATASDFSKLIVFGNSLSDNGNLYTLTKGGYPSDPPYYEGRYSDGPVWPEHLASSLGIPEENYAVSGARSDYTNVLGPYPGLRDEIDDYIASTPWGADPDALYILWAGSNDLLALEDESRATSTRANAVSNLVAGVTDLVGYGAANIAVIGLADLGLTPFARGSASPLSPSAFTEQSDRFNSDLRDALDGAGLGAAYQWVDSFAFSQQVSESPGVYGFSNAVDSCLARACVDPGTYLYYDDRHPTSAAHRVLADHYYAQISTRKRDGVVVTRITGGSNDAEERPSGSVTTTSSDLELVQDGSNQQTVGLRFVGIDVPPGSTITNAYVQFQVDEVSTASASLRIEGQLGDSPSAFSTSKYDISTRPRTTSSVPWAPASWATVGAAGSGQRTPDISAVIQEIVSQGGWSSNDALVLIIGGTGKRVAESYNGSKTGAPLLHIEYSGGTPTASAAVFGPSERIFATTVDVALSTSTANATIYYTLGIGSDDPPDPEPDGSETFAYTGSPINLTQTTTIKAMVKATGYANSAVSKAVYTQQQGGSVPALEPVGDKSVISGETLVFSVTASDDNGPPELTVDASGFPSGNQPAFTSSNSGSDTVENEFRWTPQVSDIGKTYPLEFTATDTVNSALKTSEVVEVSVVDASSGVTLDYRITGGSNDAEERPSGSVTTTSSDLELVQDGSNQQTVGLRFVGIDVPPGSTITNAYVQFQVDEVSTASASLRIEGQLGDSPSAFSTSKYDISTRPRTTSSVPWAPASWATVGAAGSGQRTPDISAVIQEIVSQGGWSSNDALVLIIGGTGKRVAESYNGSKTGAPLLHIEYSGGTPTASAAVFGPSERIFATTVDVALSTSTANATIYYTLGIGSDDPPDPEPDGSETFAYTGSPINLTQTTTIKAMVKATGYANSAVSKAVYTQQQGGSVPALEPVGDKSVISGETLVFSVTASDDNGPPELTVDASGFPSGNQPAFTSSNSGSDTVENEFRWTPQVSDIGKTYPLEFTATDTVNSALKTSEVVEVSVVDASSGVTLDYRITGGSNDAEERPSGSVTTTSSDLELVQDGSNQQTVGLRFVGIDVPPGSTITNAYVQFQVDEVSTASASLRIEGQLGDSPSAFSTSKYDISTRPRTTSSVPWAPASWATVGAAGSGQRTPDISAVIQEIVSQGGWSSNDALVLIIGGTGKRVAESYNGSKTGAPLLHIEYSGGTPTASAAVFGPSERIFATTVDVALSTSTANATIYYTLGIGSDDPPDPEPDGSETFAYTGSPINLTQTTTIKAMVKATGYANSAVSKAVYTQQQGGSVPALEPVGDRDASSAQRLEFTVWASDEDGGIPTLSASFSSFPSGNRPDFVTSSGTSGTVNGKFSWTPGASDVGRTYQAVFTAADSADSALKDSETIDVRVVDGSTAEYRVRSSDDDGEERPSGNVILNSSDLELVEDGSNQQTVGVRFTGVDVPQGASINNAWIQFQVDEVSTGSTSLQLHAQASDNAGPLLQQAFNLTNRPSTSSVAWSDVPAWTQMGAAGAAQRTPNLAPVVQQVVDRGGWRAGNAMLFVITGSGKRVASSYDGSLGGAPRLHIEYAYDGNSGGDGSSGDDADAFNEALYAFVDEESGGGASRAEEVADGYLGKVGNGWVPSNPVGAEISLSFDGPKTVSKVVLSDLSGPARVTQATIRLRSGQSVIETIRTAALSDDGSPVEFPVALSNVTNVSVTIDSASGAAGLGEVEVHADLDGRTVDYKDNFNDGNSSAWSVPVDTGPRGGSSYWLESGGRMVEDSRIQGQDSKGYEAGTYRILNAFDHSDADIRLRVKANANGFFGLMFGYQTAGNYYRLVLASRKSYVKLEKVSGGIFSELAGSTQAYDLGEWTNLRVVIDQGVIVAYLNGEQVVAAADGGFSGGRVALWEGGSPGEPTLFDNLCFLSPPTEPLLAVLAPVSEYAVFPRGTIPAAARVLNAPAGGSVRFTIDAGTDPDRPTVRDGSTPYQADFAYGPNGPAPDGPDEHQLRVDVLDGANQSLESLDATVSRLVLGVYGIKAVVIGDSIGYGVGDDDANPLGDSPDQSDDSRNSGGGFPPILNNALTDAGRGPVTIVKEANPGDKAADVLPKIDAILARNPGANAFLVMFGSNDAYGSMPVEADQYQSSLRQLVERLEATGGIVFVATPPAVDEGVVGDATRNETLEGYRDKVIELVDTYSPSAGMVRHGPDFFTLFKNSLGGAASDDLLGSDGLHPDGAGYADMGEQWKLCMEAVCDYL